MWKLTQSTQFIDQFCLDPVWTKSQINPKICFHVHLHFFQNVSLWACSVTDPHWVELGRPGDAVGGRRIEVPRRHREVQPPPLA